MADQKMIPRVPLKTIRVVMSSARRSLEGPLPGRRSKAPGEEGRRYAKLRGQDIEIASARLLAT